MDLTRIIKETFSYDADTGIFSFKSGKSKGRRLVPFTGAVDGAGYARCTVTINGKQKVILAHRAAWVLHYGCMPGGCIDHINGDVLDNRINNLRDVDASTNQKNRGLSKANTSGKTGVRRHRSYGRYYAEITDNGQRLHIGSYGCVTAAIVARTAEETKRGFISRV